MDEAIALVHAGEVQQQDFRRISDGQRQRLMLARAICQDTQVLILDEPTSYLDMGFKLDILTTIRMLARKKTWQLSCHCMNWIWHRKFQTSLRV